MTVGGCFRVGVLSGHQVVPSGDPFALSVKAREMDVDVLVSGHTHELSVIEQDSILFLNPGSVTGAFSTLTHQGPPSLALMEVSERNLVVFTYTVEDGEMKVSRHHFQKPQA